MPTRVRRKPFAVDTPTQRDTASGRAFINFGWALGQQPKMVAIDGSTITALIDDAPTGNVRFIARRRYG